MNRKLNLLFVFCLVLPLCLLGCKDFGTSPGKQVTRPLTELEKSLLQTSNQFGFHLLRAVNQAETDSNVFISPLSVSMALGMTLNGANGTTEEAMRSTLGFSGMTQEEINTTYYGLMQLLRNLDPKVRFDIANSIWYRLGFKVEQGFVETNQRYFEAIVRGLEFGSAEASRTINSWVDKSTSGKIQRIVPDVISPDVVMYLINAIYFKGMWTYKFDTTRTSDAPFHLPDGTTAQARLMQVRGTFSYAETAAYQAIELPYGDSLFSMIVVLPCPGQSIEAFVDEMTNDSWNAIKEGLHPQLGTMYLPKFKLEFGKSLVDQLRAMGMGVAFGAGADFTKINRDGGLFISDVEHKTFVQVDEEGTEAAAVTSVEISRTSVGPPEFVMRVDRPFFFVITERSSGTLLFVGKIVEPK
ncbi:MAG: serpin family protein [Bacteroidota bacterium]|jgi:serpin B